MWMFLCGIAKDDGDGDDDKLLFKLYIANEPGRPKPVTLKAVCGPDENGQHVITILLPEED